MQNVSESRVIRSLKYNSFRSRRVCNLIYAYIKYIWMKHIVIGFYFARRCVIGTYGRIKYATCIVPADFNAAAMS